MRSLDTEDLVSLKKNHLCAVYISLPFFCSGNQHFDTFLFLTGAPKVVCIMFRDCHNHTGRGCALDWNHRTFGELTFIILYIRHTPFFKPKLNDPTRRSLFLLVTLLYLLFSNKTLCIFQGQIWHYILNTKVFTNWIV